MKTRKFPLIMILAGSLLASSCIMYKPQSVDVPLINHQGDCRIDGAVSISPIVIISEPDINVTGSYGVTEWGAVQLHANYNGDKGIYGQAAVGYYHPIDKAVLEVYAGCGYGSNEFDYSSDKKNLKGNHKQFFVQPNFGWVDLANGHIDLGIGLKCGYFMPDFTESELDENSDMWIETSRYTKKSPLFEPQFFFRAGGKHLKFTLRFGYCEFFDDEMFNGSDAIYAPFTVSAGLNYRF